MLVRMIFFLVCGGICCNVLLLFVFGFGRVCLLSLLLVVIGKVFIFINIDGIIYFGNDCFNLDCSLILVGCMFFIGM